MSSLTRRQRLRFRITATWRSVLSWMRWRQRRATRERLHQMHQDMMLALLRAQLEQQFRRQLWEMAVPLAEALQRLDRRQELTRSRLQVMQSQQLEMRNHQEELLLEILQGQMPPAYQQLGLSTPPQLPPSLVT